MKLSWHNLAIMLAAALVTIAVLWSGQQIYRTSAVRHPLVRAVEQVAGVRKAWMRAGASGTLTVQFRPTADVMATYQAVGRAAQRSLGHSAKVTVVGEPNSWLNALENRVRLIIAQGEATGQYVAMSRQVSELAQARGARATVEVGNYHLFVSLRKGQHYLDAVIPITLGEGGMHA